MRLPTILFVDDALLPSDAKANRNRLASVYWEIVNVMVPTVCCSVPVATGA